MNRKFTGQGEKKWQDTPQGKVIVSGVNRIVDEFFTYLKDPKIREDFFMQELDGAYSGNAASKKWVKNTGIPRERFKNSLSNDSLEAERIQQAITLWIMAFCQDFSRAESARIRRNIVSFMLGPFPVRGFDFEDFTERDTGEKSKYKGPVF